MILKVKYIYGQSGQYDKWTTSKSISSCYTKLLCISDSDLYFTGALEIVQTSKQHDYEAWICTYDTWDPNLIYSGGDDCKLKIWDLRSCNRGVVIGKK